MNKAGRVRIRIQQRDGTCPTPEEACESHDGKLVPFPRGQNVQISIVHDDGTETRLRNVKRAQLLMGSRYEAVTCLLELFNPVVDVVVPAEFVENTDPEGGDFLGEVMTLPV